MGRRRARPVADIRGLAHDLGLERRLAPQAVDQGCHRAAGIAGLYDVAQRKPVGFQLLLARISSQRQKTVLGDRTADIDRTAGGSGLDGGVEHPLADPGALGRMTLDQMTEFVADRGGQLGLVLEEREESARDEDIGLHGVGIGDR